MTKDETGRATLEAIARHGLPCLRRGLSIHTLWAACSFLAWETYTIYDLDSYFPLSPKTFELLHLLFP